MIYLSMLLFLVLAVVLQALLPPVGFLWNSKVPLVFPVTIYYAFHQPRQVVMVSALAGGILQDALSLMPLGYSGICFCVVASILSKFRNSVFEQEWITNVVAGGLGCAFVTLLTGILLVLHGYQIIDTLAGRVAGAAVLGALATQLVAMLVRPVDEFLGNDPDEVLL